MAKMEWQVTTWLCCCFRITMCLLQMQTIIFYQQMQTISFSVFKYFKLYILVLMIMINIFPQFFNASVHSDIIKDQTGKRFFYILAFFVSHLFQIFTESLFQETQL